MWIKIYGLLNAYVHEISINLIFVKFKIPKTEAFEWLARRILTAAQQDAVKLLEEDSWILLCLDKRFLTNKKYSDNPWMYQSTLVKKLCAHSYKAEALDKRLRYYAARKISETKLGRQSQPIWRLTEYGKQVLEACNYIQYKYPEIHAGNE